MPLTAKLASPLALFRKLERESYRAYHAASPLHKADHFFNFCVTASSMRDYTLEHLGMFTHSQQQPYHDAWSKVPALVAAAEIANTSKHFVLRDRGTGKPKTVKTRTLRMRKARFVDVYFNEAGEPTLKEVERTDVSVTLSDGQILELYSFTEEVFAYWKAYLAGLGFRVRRQPFSQLSGR
jgi:hypothetical protein